MNQILRPIALLWMMLPMPRPAVADEIWWEQRLVPAPVPIVIPVELGDLPARLMIDTGFGSDVVEPPLRSQGGPATAIVNVDGFGPRLKAGLFDLPSVSVNHHVLPPQKAIAMELSRFKRLNGLNFQGILGMPAFRRLAIEFDFDRRRLRIIQDFTAPKSAEHFRGSMKPSVVTYLPLMIEKNASQPGIDATLEDMPLHLLLDTGNLRSLGVRHTTFESLKASGAIIVDPAHASTETSTASVKLSSGRFTRGTLLGVSLKDCVVDDAQDVDILGLGFLLNFDCTIDYPSGRFYFRPRTAPLPADPGQVLGISCRYESGRCSVAAVNRGNGFAREAGFRPGDAIVQLGPLRNSDLNCSTLYELCESYAGRRIDVEIARPGEPRTIKKKIAVPGRTKLDAKKS